MLMDSQIEMKKQQDRTMKQGETDTSMEMVRRMVDLTWVQEGHHQR